MIACGGCGDYIPDGSRFCPACGASQDGSPPPPPPSREPGPPGGPPSSGRGAALVRALGTLYVTYGVMLFLFVAWSFFETATGKILRNLAELRRDMPPEWSPAMDLMEEVFRNSAALAVMHVVPFGLAVLFVWSGNRLRALQGRTAALTAAALVVLCSPCLGYCCCLGVPLAVWALVVLTRFDVETLMK